MKPKAYDLYKKAKRALHKRDHDRRALRKAAGFIPAEEYRRARAITGNGLDAVYM